MKPTVYVVDVGQGSCNVVVTGKAPKGRNQAVVIDCGPVTPDIQLELLESAGVDWINALVVSHNDRDHCGGLEKILGQYRHRIERTFFTGDRDASTNEAFKMLDQFYGLGFMETNPTRPKGFEPIQIALMDGEYQLFPPEAESADYDGIRLYFIAPTGTDAYRAAAKRDSNQASAIVVAEYGKSKFVFPGDANIPAWDSLFNRMGRQLTADVLVVPHHGGLIHNPANSKELERLFNEITRCEFAVISAGTNNNQGGPSNPASNHPRQDVLEAIYDAGLKVVCTEMTENCSCLKSKQIMKHRGRKVPMYPSFSKIDRGKVPCAGTICVVMQKSGVKFVNCDEIHGDDWESNQTGCCPIAP